MATTRLGLDTLTENQAAAEVTFNQAMSRLDALTSIGVADWRTAPPTGVEGAVYLVKATGTGLWAGHDNQIAFFHNGLWRFTTPALGMICYVAKIAGVAANTLYFWKDTSDPANGTGDTWTLGPILEETPEDADTADKDAISGHIAYPEVKDYTLELYASEPYTIDKVSAITSTGTCDVRLSLNGAADTGTLVNVTSTIAHQAEAIAIVATNKIELVVSNLASNPADLAFTIAISKPLSAGDD